MGGSYCCGSRCEMPDLSVSAERLSDEDQFENFNRSPLKSRGTELTFKAENKVSILKNKNKAAVPFPRNNKAEVDNGVDVSKNLTTRVSLKQKGVVRENREFYSKIVDRNVLWVLGMLWKVEIDRKIWNTKIEAKRIDLSQYGFKKIREFLIVNNQDVELVVDLIIGDIKWRNLYIPINQSDIMIVEKSNKIKLTSIDGETEPWILIKPNASCSDLKENCTQLSYGVQNNTLKKLNLNNAPENNSKIIHINEKDYLNFLIYCFENLDDKLKHKGYDTKYTINIDFDSDFDLEDETQGSNILNFQLVKMIYKLIVEHYPMKVTWINVMNAKMKHIMALSFLKIRCIPAVAPKPWTKNSSNAISWDEFVRLKSSFC